MADDGRRGALSVGAGNCDHGFGNEPGCKLQLRKDLNPRGWELSGNGPFGDAGAQDRHLPVLEMFRAVSTGDHIHSQLFGHLPDLTAYLFRNLLQKPDLGPECAQEPDGSKAGTAGSHDYGAMPVQLSGMNQFSHCSYRSFRVLSATRAKMMDRIQNRMMILDSGIPLSSK